MKIMAMAAMAMVVGVSARAEQKVTVYAQDVSVVPARVLDRALFIAAEMLAGAGVRIDWRIGQPSDSQLQRERAIVVRLTMGTPAEFQPAAFAFARPYEGIHITVFWDRVQHKTTSATAAVVLAHVLVHEITHVLQGIDRHSESGLMKASWTGQDYAEMTWKPLAFTAGDIDLLQLGLAKRDGVGTLIAANSAAR